MNRLKWITNNVIALMAINEKLDHYTAYLIAEKEWNETHSSNHFFYLPIDKPTNTLNVACII